MRDIILSGAANVRDLGGYKTMKGEVVSLKKAIRSAAIDQLTVKDSETLADYGVVKVVDFRSTSERQSQPDATIAHAENIFLPIFAEKNTQVSAAPTTLMEQIQAGQDAVSQMKEVYRHFVEEDYCRQSYRKFLEILLATEDKNQGVLFHCTAGKDRTGFAAALILGLLEVDQETILANYLETNQNLQAKTQAMLHQAQTAGANEAILTGIEALMRADQSYLTESLTSIKDNYGNFEGYFTEGLHLSKNDLATFRKLYAN